MNEKTPTFGMRQDVQDLSNTSSAQADFINRETQRASRKLQVLDPNDDEEIRARAKHCLKKGEQLGQFYSRTGLSRVQILQMSKSEITAFVEVAAQNAVEEIPVTFFERPPTPQRIVVEV